MSYFEAIVLGLVQGLTEFLPVSSSGHLVMTQAFLGIPQPGIFLEVVLHIATMLSVMVVYRKRLLQLLVGTARLDRGALRYVGLLALATLPVALVGFFFRHPIEAAFDAPVITGVMLLVTGIILMSTRFVRAANTDDEPRTIHALAMGILQVLALFPGISRSGSTIAAGLWTGLRGEKAAEFSFLMSLIAIAGAGLLMATDLEAVGVIDGPLVAGFFAALVSGVAAIVSLVWLIRHQHFHLFAWYVWPVGIVFLIYLYLG
jgi:undecaprenyl-diphosphatase